MSGRLIVVSNRIPTGDVASGGLVVAMQAVLEERGGLWVGAHPDFAERDEGAFVELKGGPTSFRRFGLRLPQALYEDYYLGFGNSVLWPVCHRRGDLVRLDRDYLTAYCEVNRRLAERIARLAEPDDTIWVHDYHLLPLAMELRKQGVCAPIGFFLHIPFPTLGDLGALPESAEFARWLSCYDVVGLQTRADVARCIEMYRADPRAELLRDGSLKRRDRVFSVRSFPIGIDVEAFRKAAETSREDHRLGPDLGGDVIIGVDRLDYSKGLPNRFRAFGRYLENRSDRSRRVSLLQIAPPTREQVSAYRQIRSELEEIAGRLNGEHSELDWTPLRYIHRSVSRDLLARLYRRAKVGLVTPFADGMNLVAKEYVTAQQTENPGVLVLSRTAGAAEDMTSGLLVNPYDVAEISEAIDVALTMPLDERRSRHAAAMEVVRETDVNQWSARFLKVLDRCDTPLV